MVWDLSSPVPSTAAILVVRSSCRDDDGGGGAGKGGKNGGVGSGDPLMGNDQLRRRQQQHEWERVKSTSSLLCDIVFNVVDGDAAGGGNNNYPHRNNGSGWFDVGDYDNRGEGIDDDDAGESFRLEDEWLHPCGVDSLLTAVIDDDVGVGGASAASQAEESYLVKFENCRMAVSVEAEDGRDWTLPVRLVDDNGSAKRRQFFWNPTMYGQRVDGGPSTMAIELDLAEARGLYFEKKKTERTEQPDQFRGPGASSSSSCYNHGGSSDNEIMIETLRTAVESEMVAINRLLFGAAVVALMCIGLLGAAIIKLHGDFKRQVEEAKATAAAAAAAVATAERRSASVSNIGGERPRAAAAASATSPASAATTATGTASVRASGPQVRRFGPPLPAGKQGGGPARAATSKAKAGAVIVKPSAKADASAATVLPVAPSPIQPVAIAASSLKGAAGDDDDAERPMSPGTRLQKQWEQRRKQRNDGGRKGEGKQRKVIMKPQPAKKHSSPPPAPFPSSATGPDPTPFETEVAAAAAAAGSGVAKKEEAQGITKQKESAEGVQHGGKAAAAKANNDKKQRLRPVLARKSSSLAADFMPRIVSPEKSGGGGSAGDDRRPDSSSSTTSPAVLMESFIQDYWGS